MGSRQSFATPHSRVPNAMIGQYTLKPDTHSNRDIGSKVYLHLKRVFVSELSIIIINKSNLKE